VVVLLPHLDEAVACYPKTGVWGMSESPEPKEIQDEEEAVFGRANHRASGFYGSPSGVSRPSARFAGRISPNV